MPKNYSPEIKNPKTPIKQPLIQRKVIKSSLLYTLYLFFILKDTLCSNSAPKEIITEHVLQEPKENDRYQKFKNKEFKFQSKYSEIITIYFKNEQQTRFPYEIYNLSANFDPKFHPNPNKQTKPKKLPISINNYLKIKDLNRYSVRFRQNQFYKLEKIFTFNFAINSFIMEYARSQETEARTVGYLTNTLQSRRSSLFNFALNQIKIIKDFPIADYFLVWSFDNIGNNGVGIIFNQFGQNLEIKLLNFNKLMPSFRGLGLTPFNMRDPRSGVMSHYAILYSNQTLRVQNQFQGDNSFMLVSVDFRGVKDPKFKLLQRTDITALMRIIRVRFADLKIISVNSVWIDKAKDYILHVIYSAILTPGGKYHLYEAYIGISYREGVKLNMLINVKVAYRNGIVDSSNPDLEVPEDKYQVTINHWNATIFSGVIEDRNDHQVIYILSTGNKECGIHESLKQRYGIYKLCVSNVQRMVNDCNMDLKDPKLSIGPALPINSTTVISTIIRQVDPEKDFAFLPKQYQSPNTTEIVALIFRQNTTSPKISNYCDKRTLNVTKEGAVFKYDRWVHFYNDYGKKSLNIYTNNFIKLENIKNISSINNNIQLASDSFTLIRISMRDLSVLNLPNQIQIIINFKEVGYSKIDFTNKLYINFIEENEIVQIQKIYRNILQLDNLRGSSKYKIDFLPLNLYQINSKEIVFNSIGSMIYSNDQSMHIQKVINNDEVSDDIIVKIFDFGDGYLGVITNFNKFLRILRCFTTLYNNYRCQNSLSFTISEYIRTSLKVLKVGKILVFYGKPILDRDGELLVSLRIFGNSKDFKFRQSFKYKPISSIVIKNYNNQALLYYLSENNKLIFFRVVSTGQEKDSNDLKYAFTFMGSYLINDYLRIKIQNLKWAHIDSFNFYGLYTSFILVSEPLKKNTYRYEFIAYLENNDLVSFYVNSKSSQNLNYEVIRVCNYGITSDFFIKNQNKYSIKRVIYSIDFVQTSYNIDIYNLHIFKMIDLKCLPKGTGVAIYVIDNKKQKALILLNRHPGNYGQLQGTVMAKIVMEKNASFDNVSFQLEGKILYVTYGHKMNSLRRWVIHLSKNQVVIRVSNQISFDSFSNQEETGSKKYLGYKIYSKPLKYDGSSPSPSLIKLKYDNSSRTQIMEGKFSLKGQADTKLKVSLFKKSGKSKFMLKKGYNDLESYMKIEGEYQGAYLKQIAHINMITENTSDNKTMRDGNLVDVISSYEITNSNSTNNSNATSNNSWEIKEGQVEIIDRLHLLDLNTTELKYQTFDFIDTQGPYTAFCSMNSAIYIYKDLGTPNSKLVFNSSNSNPNIFNMVKFSNRFDSSKNPYIIFIGGVQGIINNNNRFSNKIVLFYFKKDDPQYQIYSKEVGQQIYNRRITDNSALAIEFDTIQVVSYQVDNNKFKLIAVDVQLIKYSLLNKIKYLIDVNNPNTIGSSLDPIREIDGTFIYYTQGITVGEDMLLFHPGFPFVKVGDFFRKNMNLKGSDGTDYLRGFISSRDNTNFLLTYDEVDLVEWKGLTIEDRRTIKTVRRVLDHEYLAVVPSSSKKYFGFIIRELHLNPKTFRQLKLVVYSMENEYAHQILPIRITSTEGLHREYEGIASISESDHLYLSSNVARNITKYQKYFKKISVFKINSRVGIISEISRLGPELKIKFKTRDNSYNFTTAFLMKTSEIQEKRGFNYEPFKTQPVNKEDEKNSGIFDPKKTFQNNEEYKMSHVIIIILIIFVFVTSVIFSHFFFKNRNEANGIKACNVGYEIIGNDHALQ